MSEATEVVVQPTPTQRAVSDDATPNSEWVASWQAGGLTVAAARVAVDGGYNTLKKFPGRLQLVGVGGKSSTELRVYSGPSATVTRTFMTAGPRIFSVATDGDTVAAGDNQGLVHLFELAVDASEHQLAAELDAHSGYVFGLAFVAAGKLVSGSADNLAKLWTVRERRCTATLSEHTADVNCVDATDALIATASDDGTVKIWSPHGGGASRRTLVHPEGVNAVHIAGDVLASGCRDGAVRTYSVASGKLTRTLLGHSHFVLSVHVCGGALVSGSLDKTVKVWSIVDAAAGECLATLEGHTSNVSGVVVLPDADGVGWLIASLSATQNVWKAGQLIVYKPVGQSGEREADTAVSVS
jgi:WD40 repeat protein